MRNSTEMMNAILTSPKAQEIISYVSPIYGDSYVALWIFQAMGTVLGEVCDIAGKLMNEGNPATAELMLDYWEEHYGLPVRKDLPVEQRRSLIMTKMQAAGPCNPYKMEQAVSGALGGARVDIKENVDKNTFQVFIRDYVPNVEPAVEVIEKMKPAHLLYLLNTVIQERVDAEVYTAVAFTHSESIKVEVLQ